MIAKVEPLTRARALRGPFDYRVPDRMPGVDVGTVLVIPFGRRRAVGVVVEMAETSDVPDSRLVEPISSLEADLQPELLELGLQVAAEYCSTPARGLALVLPPGTGTGPRSRIRTKRRLVATLTEAGYDALGRRRWARAQAAGGARGACARVDDRGRGVRGGGLHPRDAPLARGPRAGRDRGARAAAAAGHHDGSAGSCRRARR